MLRALANDSFGVLELAQIFATGQSGMSHHLKVLAQAGLVATRREGNAIFYRRALAQGERLGGTLHAALLAYGFDADPQAALARMADAEGETLILHELGEFEAGQWLGGEWQAMCAGFTGRRAELVARALRDNLADCLVTLPTLLDRGAARSIHFWFSNFDGIRRELFPRLADTYAAWCEGNQGAFAAAIAAGREHWLDRCVLALSLHRDRGAGAESPIAGLLDAADARL